MTAKYRYGTVLRLTMDDPQNDHMPKGTMHLKAGKHENGWSHTVIDEEKEGFTEVKSETVAVYEAAGRMDKDAILEFTKRKANEDDVGGGQS